MRNVIIHRYSAVVPEVVWKTVTEDLPTMVAALQGILASTRGD